MAIRALFTEKSNSNYPSLFN